MRVFITGSTGFVGSAIVQELIEAGHRVLGLTRSDAGAEALIAAGAEAHRGDLEDLESLRRGAADSDAVIHTAFNHDFSKFAENCETDRRVVEALGSALVGSDRLLVVTSGTGIANTEPGTLATEDRPPVSSKAFPRAATEEAVGTTAQRGVRVAIVRLPQVHDTVRQGLVSYAIRAAREKGVSAYVDDGLNRWPAAHRHDTATLYRLALEKREAGARYHAVAEEGIATRAIAEVVGRGLRVPVVSLPKDQAAGHFGWLAPFMLMDIPASGMQTQQQLGWKPTGPGLLSDLGNMRYFAD